MARVFGDLFDIGGRVRAIDPALTLMWDKNKKAHILKRGKHLVMTIPHGQLDARVLTILRKNDTSRMRLEDFIREFEREEEAGERIKQHRFAHTTESIAREHADALMGIRKYGVQGVNWR